jgi:hypothetical protein
MDDIQLREGNIKNGGLNAGLSEPRPPAPIGAQFHPRISVEQQRRHLADLNKKIAAATLERDQFLAAYPEVAEPHG